MTFTLCLMNMKNLCICDKLTQSTCEKSAFQMMPRALQIAFEEDIEFRKSLPKDYMNYMGVAFSDVVSRRSYMSNPEFVHTTECVVYFNLFV